MHEIHGWDDLRRRLDPADRRCFAFFHPSLVDEPLIFVEVALTREIPDSIRQVLEERKGEAGAADHGRLLLDLQLPGGLKGISFGNFLIKQVVEDLAREQPILKTFVTLSPVPQFTPGWGVTAGDAADGSAMQALGDPGCEARVAEPRGG